MADKNMGITEFDVAMNIITFHINYRILSQHLDIQYCLKYTDSAKLFFGLNFECHYSCLNQVRIGIKTLLKII